MSSLVNLVIPAAGSATRLRPLSSNTSKVMVRVNGKPCLDYIIEQARSIANINEIVVVDGAFDDIREYCSIRHPDVKLVKQGSLNGPRDAIKVGMNVLDNPSLPVVVWLGDAIILQEDMPLGTDFLLTKQVKDHSAWCMWDGSSFYNKPSSNIPNSSALVGLYSFFDGLNAKKAFNTSDDYDISHALELYVESNTNFDNVNTDKWYDIGELHSYYKTCAELLNLKSRAFNNIEYDSELGTIRKSPDYHNQHSVDTIKNEKSWYKNLSPEQSLFTPRVLDTNYDIVMSYESGTLLSDLMLYENLSPSAWEYIMDKVFSVKTKFFDARCDDSGFMMEFDKLSNDMWVSKSGSRLRNVGFSVDVYDSLLSTANACYRACKPISGMHGDLHFGNILYNQQTDQIKLIDPRGNYGSFRGVFGDNLYDWAKLAHDLYHGYGAMVANVPRNEEVKETFLNKLKEYNLPVDLILAGGLLLIATCIPLHYDDPDRQERFIDYIKENYEKYSV